MSPSMTADLRGRDCPAYGAERGDELWTVPWDVGDRRELDAWCRAVGPPVFQPDATIRGPRLEDHDSIAIVVWNVSVGGGDVLGLLQDEVGVECGPEPTAGTHVVLLWQSSQIFVVLMWSVVLPVAVLPSWQLTQLAVTPA